MVVSFDHDLLENLKILNSLFGLSTHNREFSLESGERIFLVVVFRILARLLHCLSNVALGGLPQ